MSDPIEPKSPRMPAVNREPAATRRRVLQGGLAAAPVLMTLLSRPVLGQGQCVTPSAFCSGNASVAGVAVVCAGLTADYWADAPSWPEPFTPDTPFNTVFGPNPQYACDTLLDVLSPPDNAPPEVPEEPAPPPPAHGHRHNPDRVRTPKARDEPSPGSGGGSHHGSFRPMSYKALDLGSSDGAALHPAVLSGGDSRHGSFLQVAHRTLDLGRSGEEAPGPLDGAALGRSPHKHKHKATDPGLDQGADQGTEPPPSDPGPVDPLGCNNNNNDTAPAPEPSSPAPSDPAPPSLGRHKHRSNSNSRGLRSPTQQDALARHIVAALLNAQAGFTPGVSVRTVKGIWNEFVTKGYFEPTAGVQWGLQDILTYLASTQPA